jgi:hypothetical protein
MPGSTIYVDPSVTSAAGIIVDGVSYGMIGSTAVAPTTSAIESECPPGCDACPPASCTCPDGLADTYTWSNSGGSVVLFRVGDSCVWQQPGGGTAQLSLGGAGGCTWVLYFFDVGIGGGVSTKAWDGGNPLGMYTDNPSTTDNVVS